MALIDRPSIAPLKQGGGGLVTPGRGDVTEPSTGGSVDYSPIIDWIDRYSHFLVFFLWFVVYHLEIESGSIIHHRLR